MFRQIELGITTSAQKRKIRSLVKDRQINLAGNCHLKIYGRLNCNSGKRMKAENRVLFKSQVEAIRQGYRPCGHCMPKRYHQWKQNKQD